MEKAEREKAEREKEEEALKIFYLCNGAMAGCPKTNCYKNGGWCDHTSDINAAVNFEKGRRLFYEKGGYFKERNIPSGLDKVRQKRKNVFNAICKAVFHVNNSVIRKRNIVR